MKKLLLTMLSVLIVMSLVACGDKKTASKSEEDTESSSITETESVEETSNE